jgi:peptide/nickel transport system substrate-binding protein
MFIKFLKVTLLALAMMSPAGLLQAKEFKWAGRSDIVTMEPYWNVTFNVMFLANIYEPLIGFGADGAFEYKLATSFEQIEPMVWRYKLRKGVSFQDGSPFTSADVAFSYKRVQEPTSSLGNYAAHLKEVRVIDDYTVDFVTDIPMPIFPRQTTRVGIMSKAWAEQHDATAPAGKKSENYASTHTNGTGPFKLKEWVPGTSVELEPNESWWGGKRSDGVTNAKYFVISNPMTQLAAFLSGEIDLIQDPSFATLERLEKEPNVKLLSTPNMGIILVGMDVARDELLESSVKGANPFKDKRVRQAIYDAIDVDAIISRIMRGYAIPQGSMIGKGVNGYDEQLSARTPFDLGAARKLLAEAGYPNGFNVGMDCPNNRYTNDEAICRAVATMLSQIGINVTVNYMPAGRFFTKIGAPDYQTSLFLYGWAPPTRDALHTITNLVKTRDIKTRSGFFNISGYSNPKVDELADKIEVEIDVTKRNAYIKEVATILKDDIAMIPLHQDMIIWAAKKNITAVPDPENVMVLSRVRVD